MGKRIQKKDARPVDALSQRSSKAGSLWTACFDEGFGLVETPLKILLSQGFLQLSALLAVEFRRNFVEHAEGNVFQRPVVASLGREGDVRHATRLEVAQRTASPRIAIVHGVRNHRAAENQDFRVRLWAAAIVFPVTRWLASAGWNFRSSPATAKPTIGLPSSTALAASSRRSTMRPSSTFISSTIGGFQRISRSNPYCVARAQRAIRSPAGILSCGWYHRRRRS